MLYLDSSALVKKYVREQGSNEIQARLAAQSGADAIPFTSILTYAEILAVFARRSNDGTLKVREAAHARNEFEGDWAVGLAPIPLDSGVLLIVRALLSRIALKGSDAIHLASAIWLRDMVRTGTSSGQPSRLVFATSDAQLAKAALEHGLEVFNPQIQQFR